MKPDVIKPLRASERAIVTCGLGPTYAGRFDSARTALDRHCSDAWRVLYSDYPNGCPPQAQHKYAFKIFAITEALRLGFRYILWLDVGVTPVASIEPLWRVVEDQGWYVGQQDAERTGDGCGRLGPWCSDDALAIYGIDRETAMGIPLVRSGIVGLDMENPVARRIWETWRELYERGAFDGHHDNAPHAAPVAMRDVTKTRGHCSDDPRVRGHRHDEAALAYVLWALDLEPQARGFMTLESRETGFLRHWEAG